MAVCGGLLSLTEKFRFPDMLRMGLYPLELEQKVADICQIGRFLLEHPRPLFLENYICVIALVADLQSV